MHFISSYLFFENVYSFTTSSRTFFFFTYEHCYFLTQEHKSQYSWSLRPPRVFCAGWRDDISPSFPLSQARRRCPLPETVVNRIPNRQSRTPTHGRRAIRSTGCVPHAFRGGSRHRGARRPWFSLSVCVVGRCLSVWQWQDAPARRRLFRRNG